MKLSKNFVIRQRVNLWNLIQIVYVTIFFVYIDQVILEIKNKLKIKWLHV